MVNVITLRVIASLLVRSEYSQTLHTVASGKSAIYLSAVDHTGARFALKSVTDHRFSNQHLLLISGLTDLLQAPQSLRCLPTGPISSLGPLSKRDFVVRKWFEGTTSPGTRCHPTTTS